MLKGLYFFVRLHRVFDVRNGMFILFLFMEKIWGLWILFKYVIGLYLRVKCVRAIECVESKMLGVGGRVYDSWSRVCRLTFLRSAGSNIVFLFSRTRRRAECRSRPRPRARAGHPSGRARARTRTAPGSSPAPWYSPTSRSWWRGCRTARAARNASVSH